MRAIRIPLAFVFSIAASSASFAQTADKAVYACKAEAAHWCGPSGCERKDYINAETDYRLDLGKGTLAAALYTAVFSGRAGIARTPGGVAAAGLLHRPAGNPGAPLYVTVTVQLAQRTFTAVWTDPGTKNLTVAFGTCVPRSGKAKRR